MSLRPKSICCYAGCQRTIDKPAYCEAHQRIMDAKEKNRKNNHRSEFTKLYNWDWRKFRERYVKEHPLCIYCLKQDKLTPTQEVDHIVPHLGDKDLFWDEHNLQPLCKPCHSAKTAREDGGFANRVKLSTKE
jgi:5-methylcytosine-specific restriction enzyme A